MMEMFKDEDGSFDVSKMMEMLTRQQVKSNKWKVESGKARDPENCKASIKKKGGNK